MNRLFHDRKINLSFCMNVFYCTSLKLFHIKIQPSKYLLEVRIRDSFMNARPGRNFVYLSMYLCISPPFCQEESLLLSQMDYCLIFSTPDCLSSKFTQGFKLNNTFIKLDNDICRNFSLIMLLCCSMVPFYILYQLPKQQKKRQRVEWDPHIHSNEPGSVSHPHITSKVILLACRIYGPPGKKKIWAIAHEN